MRAIITAGGTGGHIYPALAIANKIKELEPDSKILYIGTHNRMEKDIIPKHGIDYEAIEIYGLAKSLKLMKRNIKNIGLIKKGIKRAKEIILEFKPDIVIGVGGYVTYPVIKAAKKCGIKIFIHEQNSIPGKSNRTLAKYADIIGISFEESRKYFNHGNIVLTGNPCSENALDFKTIKKETLGLNPNKKTVLIFTGSLGSSTVNKKVEEYLQTIDNADYEVLFVTGASLYERIDINKLPKNVIVKPYIEDLCGVMKDMDLVVSRAGASSLAEITAIGVPSILIPSPYVANNHQYYNALAIKNAGGCTMIEEANLNKNILKEEIEKILNDPIKSENMRINLKKLSINNSSTIIVNEIKKII